MNILHHKSWHVRNKNNIERVRKDEQKAADEEKDRERRKALAEQEARTDLLRNQARKRNYVIDDSEKDCNSQIQQHVNFFTDAEAGFKDKKGNEEYEKEKREEKEAYEKKIGLLTYIGQSAVDAQIAKPWYTENKQKNISDAFEKHKKTKNFLDPMKNVETALKNKSTKSREKNKHREQKNDKDIKGKSKSINELRAERLRREAKERKRVSKLLDEKLNGKPTDVVIDDRDRGYNSQFNPHLIKKKRNVYHQ